MLCISTLKCFSQTSPAVVEKGYLFCFSSGLVGEGMAMFFPADTITEQFDLDNIKLTTGRQIWGFPYELIIDEYNSSKKLSVQSKGHDNIGKSEYYYDDPLVVLPVLLTYEIFDFVVDEQPLLTIDIKYKEKKYSLPLKGDFNVVVREIKLLSSSR